MWWDFEIPEGEVLPEYTTADIRRVLLKARTREGAEGLRNLAGQMMGRQRERHGDKRFSANSDEQIQSVLQDLLVG